MSDQHAVYSRSIKKVRSAHINIISPQHQNSFILENGQFEENDPFLFLAEDWFQRGVPSVSTRTEVLKRSLM